MSYSLTQFLYHQPGYTLGSYKFRDQSHTIAPISDAYSEYEIPRLCTTSVQPTYKLEVSLRPSGIIMNKACGGDGIPVELFQILKDDDMKVLHSICQQIWKTQQWPQDWKRSVFHLIPKKGNAKECSNYHTIALISHASKVILKNLQARLQEYMNCELPDVQAWFRKGLGARD